MKLGVEPQKLYKICSTGMTIIYVAAPTMEEAVIKHGKYFKDLGRHDDLTRIESITVYRNFIA